MSLIYKKSLSSDLNAEESVGKIVSLVTTDAVMVGQSNFLIVMLTGVPLQLILAMYLLFVNVGWSSLVFLALLVSSSPLLDKIRGWTSDHKKDQLKFKDARVTLCNDSIGGMKSLKLYGWTEIMSKKILAVRDDELTAMRKLKTVTAATSLLSSSLPSISTFVMFALAAVISPNVLKTDNIFVTLSLVSILETPIKLIFSATNLFGVVGSCLTRIEDFMKADDRKLIIDGTTKDSNYAIEIVNGTFGFKEDTPVLKDITLSIPKGSVNFIVGSVGSGKSALLRTVLGEIKKIKGSVRVTGSIAFVPQKSFIMNGTIRDNILFGESFDEKRYSRVIQACSMVPDIEGFADGDLTVVGARGVALSGGQKARLCSARALYSQADILVMDDPLSAVDALVERQLFNSWFNPTDGILKGKTVLLVTHAIHHLSKSEIDQIISLNQGKIEGQGKFENLIAKVSTFRELVERSNTEETTENVASSAPEAASPVKADGPNGPRKEKKEEGKVSFDVYLSYIKHCGIIGSVLYFVSAVLVLGLSNGIPYFLGLSFEECKSINIGNFLGIYGGLVVSMVLVTFASLYMICVVLPSNASQSIFKTLLTNIFKFPMGFFDTTPTGEILTRISADQDAVDGSIASNIKVSWI